jgi:Tfp pilus assembly protein PilN
MMEHEINLLPPQIIWQRTSRIYLDRSGHFIRFIVFLVGLLLIVLGAVYLVVWRTQVSTAGQGESQDNRQVATLKRVRTVNDQVTAIQLWRDEHVAWTPRLPAVLAVMPSDIVLTRVSVTEVARVLELSGTFGRRESVVAFQRQLESLSWVDKVESPLSNFATGSEAKFSLLIHPKP